MLFIGRVTGGAVCALILLTTGTVLAKNAVKKTTATWQKCSESNSPNRVLGALPDTRVRVLALENCQISTLQPGDLHGLPNLENLLLGGNNLSLFDTIIFKDLRNLTTLSFDKNQIKQMLDFGKNPGVLPKLQNLQISDNEIQKLDNPKALSTLTKLHVFSANNNLIEYIHEDTFKKLPLTNISLSGNKLKYLPQKLFQNMETLNALFLDNNLLEYIPKDSFRGSGITELHIQSNKLKYMQADFLSQFQGGKLRVFRFGKNTFHCPYLLGHLLLDILKTGYRKIDPKYWTREICINLNKSQLETFDILGAECLPVVLPTGIVNKMTVTWQKCSKSNSQNRVLALPDTCARELTLENCQLTTIQPGDFYGLPNLRELLLGSNNFSHVDTILFKDLSNLTTLSFHSNQIKEMIDFGKNPGVLSKLETLKIDDNQIQKLDDPKVLSTLTELHVFVASKNRIEYIHEDMFKKLPLKTVSLSDNKLKYIPQKLFQNIKTLNTLFLDKNLIEYTYS